MVARPYECRTAKVDAGRTVQVLGNSSNCTRGWISAHTAQPRRPRFRGIMRQVKSGYDFASNDDGAFTRARRVVHVLMVLAALALLLFALFFAQTAAATERSKK